MFDLHKTDKPRFLCSLFVAEPARTNVQALLAWNAEIARVKETVSEPIIGQIRLTWWREALDEIYAGTPVRKHPVAEALATFASRLPRQYFDAILEARAEALDAEPEDARGYAHSTSGALNLLIAEVLGETNKDAAADIGTAYGLAGMGQASVVSGQWSGVHPFFKKQASIARYWQAHPECIARGGLPLRLLLRLLVW